MASRADIFQLAQVMLQRGDAVAAARSCDGLLHSFERDPAARHLRGRCLAALGRLEDAASDFRRALKLDPAYFPARADLGFTLAALGRHSQAAQALRSALSQDSRPAELHFCLGQCQLAAGDLQAAVGSFEAAVSRNPRFLDAHNNLGVVFDRLGQLEAALHCFERAAALDPSVLRVQRNIADTLRRLQRFDAAAAVLQSALAGRYPQDPQLLCELSEVLTDAGRPVEAEAPARAAVLGAATSARAHAALGSALLSSGDFAGAAAALQAALALEPQLGHAAANLGEACRHLLERGQLTAAADCLQKSALADASLHHAVGAEFHRRGQILTALASYERALALDPAHAAARVDRGNALETQGDYSAAIASFNQVPPQAVEWRDALAGSVSCAFRQCDWAGIASSLGRLESIADGIDALHPFLLLAAGVNPRRQREVFERRARSFRVQQRLPVASGSRERLRVAYLSPDFRQHAVAHALVEVIERHDRRRIETIGVSLAPPDGSSIGTRIRAAFDQLIDADCLTDTELLARLRELEIDIAIDVAGFTVGARTQVLAGRCAPVQVNYLGFPATMGAPFIDYLVADSVIVPASDAGAYTEQVVRLPQCYLPWDSTRKIPGAPPSRAAVGLPVTGFVFCGFSNSYKITRDVFSIWLSLLRELPDSVLWLRAMHPDAADNLRRAADEMQVASDRLIFAPHVERIEQHMERLGLADLFLDTFPYNAHTTAADALWAGVPVLTCLGEAFAARVGASLLTTVGLPQLICESAEKYRERAVELATRSREELRQIRSQLQESRRTAPLFDTQAYTRNLESLLFEMHGAGAADNVERG